MAHNNSGLVYLTHRKMGNMAKIQDSWFIPPGGINKSMNYSLYLHIPFCRRRCHYCDFNTYAGKEQLMPAYVDALIKEIRIDTKQKKHLPVHSLYFGGGTPSLVPVADYEKLMDAIHSNFHLTDNCEISLEANPGTLSLDYLVGLKSVGFNRISIGVQSTDSFDLVRLDRIHDLNDVLSNFENARSAGFDNISLDMIFGLPWQDLASWQNSLSRAISLDPDHFSIYSLIIEPGTPLFNWHQRGLIAPQDQDLEGDMYELAMRMLGKAGYQQYEISNWAKIDDIRDYRCRHNRQYWLNKPYLGYGAGAHGYAQGIRTVNVETIPGYIKQMKYNAVDPGPFPISPAQVSRTRVDLGTQMKDFMMLGLRLVDEGVSKTRFMAWYGRSMTEVFGHEIADLQTLGLVEWAGEEQENLRLTNRGVMVANRVFQEFV